MKLRILVVVLIATFALSAAALAQGPAAERQGNHPILAKIANDLGLTKEQRQQIGDIVRKYQADVKGVLQSSVSNDEKKAQIKDLRDKAAVAINGVLTPDQQAKAEKMHLTELLLNPGAREKMGIMWALGQLDLTDVQKTQIKQIFEDSQAAAKAIREDTSLDGAAKQAKLADLRKSTNEKVMAVLTPEQQQKLKQILQQHEGKRGPGNRKGPRQ